MMTRNLINLIFLVAVFIGAIALSASEAVVLDQAKLKPLNERSLKLRLTIAKTNYLELEPVFITYWVENTGDELQYFRMAEINKFAVRDQADTLIKYRGPEVFEGNPVIVSDTGEYIEYHDCIEIMPGQSSGRFVMCVLDFYGLGYRWSNFRLPAGTYRITGLGIKSDTISLTIARPSKTEDIEADQLMEQTLSLPGYKAADRLHAAYGEFVRRYPNSPYTSIAQRELLVSSSFIKDASTANTQSLALELLRKYPSSGFVWEALVDIDASTLDSSKQTVVAEKLRIVRETFPNSQYEQWAQKLLDKMKK
jgi:hypothetical protein